MSSFAESARIHFRSWRGVAAMALLGPFRLPTSRLWRHRLSACRSAWDNRLLDRQTELSAFLGDDVDVRIVPVASRQHNVSPDELLALCSLVVASGSRIVFEIGTFDGRTTRSMAANLSPGGRVLTLNIPPDQTRGAYALTDTDAKLAQRTVIGGRFHGTPEEQRIVQLWGDSATFDYSSFEQSVDLVFIDGAHSLDYVRSDTEAAIRLLRPEGGLIVWHDATRYGVIEFLVRELATAPFRLVAGTTIGVVARSENRFLDPCEFLRLIRPAASPGRRTLDAVPA